jgi:hypothetical protein
MKPWTYYQKTGELLRPDGTIACVGYAGHGPGRNNPALQNVRMVGPLPRGTYRIGPLIPRHPKAGVNVIRLTPVDPSKMFGRDGFLIHGNNKTNDASNGCIIAAPAVRLEIAKAGGLLEVLEDHPDLAVAS